MAKPLMYRPPPRWQLWAAFGGALVIQFAAVVIAGIHPEPPPAPDLSQIPEAVSAILEPEPAPEATPPPEEELPAPPPPPEAQPEFVEEKPTPPPPPRPKASRPPAPITRLGGTGSMSSAKAQAVFSPKPEYPYEARRQKQTGSGVCVLSVDVASGSVTDADMAQSTGSPILDSSTTSAFRRWRFRPNSVPPKVRVPITFTLTGASF
jgi:protein TonB